MVLRNQADDRTKRRPITFSAGEGRGSAALTARREGIIMMYAEYEMAAVLVLFVDAGCEVMATRLRRAHPARMPDRQAAPPLSKTHGTRSAPTDYRTGSSAPPKGLRLTMARSHARRMERRRVKKEFQAWLEITSQPL